MANLELTLRDIAHVAASAVAIGGASLLALALCAELVRRRDAGSALVRVADRLLPAAVHRIAVGILTLLATAASVATPSVASADNSLRGWLESPSVPTTVSAGSNHRSAPGPTAPQTLPAPAPTPSPPPASVVHPRTSAAPPTSSPSPAQKPSTSAPPPTPITDPTPAAPVAADPARAIDGSVRHVVIAGDCLWDIAARLIGPDASNAAIDRGWRAIYATNRAEVGDDPGLIHPGLVLTIPTLDPTP